MQNEFDFTKTKAHLTTIERLEDKIEYLLEVRTDYLQSEIYWGIERVPFDAKCTLEISKLYELMELRKENQKSRNTKTKK